MAYDDMSFSKAFAAARKEMGAGKTFSWKGKKYTTDLKEEVKGAKSPVKPKARPEGLKAKTTSAPTTSIRPKRKPVDSGSMEGAKDRKVQTTAELRAAKAKGGRGEGAVRPTVGAAGSMPATKVPMDKMARARMDAEARRKKTQEAGRPKTGEKKVVAVPSKDNDIIGTLGLLFSGAGGGISGREKKRREEEARRKAEERRKAGPK